MDLIYCTTNTKTKLGPKTKQKQINGINTMAHQTKLKHMHEADKWSAQSNGLPNETKAKA